MKIIYKENCVFDGYINANDIVAYQNRGLILLVSSEEEKNTFIYSDHGKTVIISGNIRVLNNELMKNPSEIYIEKYVHKQDLFLSNCEGDFIVIEYNVYSKSFLIFRDLLGMKHAYYTLTNYGLCISTSVNDTLKFRGKGQNNISSYSLSLYLGFQYIPQPYTLFEDIYKLPLNGTLKISKHEILIQRNHIEYQNALIKHTVNDKAKNVEDLLINYFEKQICCDYKIGVLLSGGIDSSVNVAVLAAKMGKKPITFTASFDEIEYDESRYAEIMANAYDLKQVKVNVTSDVISLLPEIVTMYNTPLADRAILSEYLILKKAEEIGIRYMVTGEGGDEVFGYPRNLSENNVRELPVDNKKLAIYYVNLCSLTKRKILNLLFGNEKTGDSVVNYLYTLYKSFRDISSFEKIYYGHWQTWLIDNVLIKDCQLFNNNSSSLMTPYMNIPLMAYFASLKLDEKLKKLSNKSYIKERFFHFLPSAILNKQKQKFHVPLAEWMRTSVNYSQLQSDLLSQNSVITAFLDRNVVSSILDKHYDNIEDNNRLLWTLLFLEYWYRDKKQYL